MSGVVVGNTVKQENAISFPMSVSQEGFWFLDQLEGANVANPILVTIHIKQRLDLEAFARSINTIVQRHKALRTTFQMIEGHPKQVIMPDLRIPLLVIDLQALMVDEGEAETSRLVAGEAQRPFNLSQGPLMRATVLQLGAEEFIVLLTRHQIVCDAWSLSILLQELTTLYADYTGGRTSSLAKSPIHYLEIAASQREGLQRDILADHLSYWRQQLAGMPDSLELPTDRPRLLNPTSQGATYRVTLPRALTETLRELSGQEEVALEITLSAAFVSLLYRYTWQNDLVIGTRVAGRARGESRACIGRFENTLVLRNDLSGNPTFRELLRRTQTVILEAQKHQDLPFERLVKELQSERRFGQNPLFQVLLAFEAALPALPLGWTLNQLGVETVTSRFDLALYLEDRPEGLCGRFEYNAALFDQTTIARLAGHWQTLLEKVVVNPEQPVATLPLLSEAERHQLLVEWNTTAREHSGDQCIHQLFDAQVERTPDAEAVVFENEHLTYKELQRKANQLAHYLQALGVGPEVLVGICVERSLGMIVGLLGILKAGGAYMPLDPTYPPERLAFMLEDARVPVLITQQSLIAGLPEHKAHTIAIDTDWNTIARQSKESLDSGTKGENLAYVIYTSGSTGRPKGVAIEQRQLMNYLKGIVERLDLPGGSSFATISTLATDLGNTAIFPSLCTGGSLHVISQDRVIDTHALVDYFQSRSIDCLKITPSHLAALQALSQTQPVMPLRRLIIGGEASQWEWMQKLQILAPDCIIFNHYGPTETTVGVLTYRVQKGPEQNDSGHTTTPLGRPIANTQIYLLDQYQNPVPIGVAGEVYIGGASVARGYLNRPELTVERFIPDRFSEQLGARLYKTGDIARYLPDGNIEFLGRIDDQIKLRGFRIEPGEIEAVFSQHNAVQQAVAVVCKDGSGEKRLVVYVILHEGQAVAVEDLHGYGLKRLPGHMVPSAIMLLEAFPLTANGKIDRSALPAPEPVRSRTKTFVPPTLLVHQQLRLIWEELLDVRPIGIQDNFFELGGHSLLATRLVNRIEEVCGQKVSLATFLARATIEHLADVLQTPKSLVSRSPIRAVQSSGSKRPFFFLHGDWTGGAFYCLELARYLGADQPFYVLEPYAFDGLAIPPTFEAMAAAHLEALRKVQPTGPYLLGGWCNGGLMAYEMARQLHTQGQTVDLLVLMDPDAPAPHKWERRIVNGLGKLLRCGLERQVNWFLTYRRLRLAFYYWRLKKLKHVRVARQGELQQGAEEVVQAQPDITFPDKETFRQSWSSIYHWVISGYQPHPYPDVVTFFWTAEEPSRQRDWRTLIETKVGAKGIEMHIIPGNHITSRTQYLPTLGKQLRECLNKAQV